MIPIGAHVDSSDPIAGAAEIGATAAQIFLGDPQSWKKPATTYPEGPAALREAAQEAELTLFVHAAYIINVASPNNRIRIPSRKLLQATVAAAAEIGAAGVIVHGGHVTGDHDDAEGFDNWRKAFESLEVSCPVLIENTAGGNHAMARYPESLARLWDSLDGFDVGFCFDTAHAWAGGMALPEDVATVKAITGRIDLVHANDSLGEANSGRDRHANFGSGTIGIDRLLDTIAAADPAAVIAETPAPGVIDDIELLRARFASV